MGSRTPRLSTNEWFNKKRLADMALGYGMAVTIATGWMLWFGDWQTKAIFMAGTTALSMFARAWTELEGIHDEEDAAREVVYV